MSNTLSPEALALASAAVVAKYTAKAWHAVPQGTTDRVQSSSAHKKLLAFVPQYEDATFVWINAHPTWTAKKPIYVWMEDEPGSDRKAGHVESIPKGWSGSRVANAPRIVFIITGSVTQNIATARRWLGTKSLRGHWLSGQHHQAAAAHMEFMAQYLNQSLGKDEALIKAVVEHSASVGCCLTYQEAHFVGDFAVGHLFNDGAVTPLWCDARAEAQGATKQDDGTWV